MKGLANIPMMTFDDIKVIYASARKILTDANKIKNKTRRHDLTVEATAIMTLCESVVGRGDAGFWAAGFIEDPSKAQGFNFKD